jgi:hypothetical protein
MFPVRGAVRHKEAHHGDLEEKSSRAALAGIGRHPVPDGPGRGRSTEFGCPNAEESATTAPVMVNAKLAKVQFAVFI